MPRSLYFPYVHRRLEHTLTRAIVRVAYPGAWEEDGKVYSGNTNHIVGFIVAEPSSIGLITHYVYTRRDYSQKGGRIEACYRQQGIARALLEGMLKDYDKDHVTFTLWGQELVKSPAFFDKVTKGWGSKMTYNPELFTTLLPPKWEQGITATLDSRMAVAIHQQKSHSPTSF